MSQSAYVAMVVVLALSLGVVRFASHRRFRVRGRLPDPPEAQRLRLRIQRAILGATAGLALVLIGSAAGWPWAVLRAGAVAAAFGWLVTGVTIPQLVRARVRGSPRRRTSG